MPRVKHHHQSGEIETSHAVLIIALLIGVIAWWQLSPQTFPLTKGEYQARQAEEMRKAAEREELIQSGATTTLYKWQGPDGSWHYDTKKPKGVEYTVIKGTPNISEMPSLEEVTPIDSSDSQSMD